MSNSIADASSLWFVFNGSYLLLSVSDGRYRVPPADVLQDLNNQLEVWHEVGDIDGIPCHTALIAHDPLISRELEWIGLRESFGLIDERLFGMAGKAFQILEWERNHQFCGRCGGQTEQYDGEWAKRCRECDLMSYPRLSPAVIMRITQDDRLLLTTSARHPEGLYTVPAGFVEPGETLEEAVAREIGEEVGIKIKNIAYFGSQPWPFPHQLMIAFTAEYDSGELQADGDEIIDAIWCTADNMPKVPSKISISRALIDSFVNMNS